MRTSLFPGRRSLAVIVAVCFAVAHGSASAATVQIFGNNTPITITDNTTATPYPSNTTVSAVAPAIVTKVSVVLSQFSHAYPADVDVLLVGPQGQRCMLMSDGGSGNPGVSNVSLTFSSTATTAFPPTSAPVTGTYRPVNYVNDLNENDPTDTFPSLSPATLTDQAADLTVYNLTDPNGVWKLYVLDDNGTDTGSIANGWLLVLTVPTVFTVNSTADTTDGVCDATNCTLREAVNAAIANPGNGDLINFSALFNTPQTINLQTALPDIPESMTIQGPGANLLTVRRDLNAATDFRIFVIASGITNGVAISGMTVSNGRDLGTTGTLGFGGGVYSASHLTLTNVNVSGNQSSDAGGVYLDGAPGVFTGSTFSNNLAVSGSAGGIGIFATGPRALRLINSTVSGNRAPNGGGGAINNIDARLEITGSTIVNNAAGGAGGVNTNSQAVGNSATTTLRNTIIALNTAPNLAAQVQSGPATFETLGFNLSDNYTGGGFTPLDSDITSATPRLGPLSLGGGQTPTHALLGGSPAHGAGDASGLAVDQRGVPRPLFAADIGAVEMVSIIVTNNNELGAGSLRQAMIDANQNATPLDDIIFSDSVFNAPQTITLTSGELVVNSNLTINGPGANLLTVRRDPNAATDFRIFNIASAIPNGVAISGMTITGGKTGSSILGGGIYSESNLVLTGVHVTGNTAGSSGGGAFLAFADGVYTNCTFSNNRATGAAAAGGGIFYQGDGDHTLRLISSTVSGNQSVTTAGGGISNGSFNSSSRLEITNSTIVNNTAPGGGGILTFTANPGNTATTMLRNTIVAGNSSNNLVTNSQGGPGTATFATRGFNLASDNGGGFLIGPGDKINAFAGLAPLGDNSGPTPTHALFGSSAALDAGNNSGSGILTDQRGASFLRTVDLPAGNAATGDGTDIGAFEAQSAPVTPTISINDVTLNEGTGGTTNFTFTVTLSAANLQDVTVSYQTADGTANAPSDYTAIPPTTLTFTSGQTSKQVTVSVVGDAAPEGDETFFVNLSNAQGAIISDSQGLGTIANDDGAAPTPTPTPASTATPTPSPASQTQLVNISTRLPVGAGDDALIAGFIVVGTQPKKVIIRGIGPSLGRGDQLGNPTLELFTGQTSLGTNDDWMDSTPADKQAVIDSTVAPSNDLEPAIVRTLPASTNGTAYTAVLRGVNNSVGIGVIEVYDLDRSVDSKLANISTRGLVQTGDKALFAGMIVLGPSTQKVIIRAIGPSLTVAGKMLDPMLELRDANGTVLRANDNWRIGGQEQEIIDSTVAPTNNAEAALIHILPGSSGGASYTAIVSGVGGEQGIAVVEVYALQ